MVTLLALLVLVVRFALHQRRPGGGGDGPDGPSGRNRGDGSDPPSPAEAVKPAQDTAREKLTAGEPPGGSRGRPGEGEEGEQGRPPDDEGDGGDGSDDDGAFTTPEPDGVPKRRDEKWLERKGVDAHEVKDILPGPAKWFDVYVDRSGNMWGVRKGTDPRQGEYLGNIDDYGD